MIHFKFWHFGQPVSLLNYQPYYFKDSAMRYWGIGIKIQERIPKKIHIIEYEPVELMYSQGSVMISTG